MKKRHHFLPRSYLRGFSREPKTKNEKIWTYDKSTGSCLSSTCDNTGFEKYFYSVTTEDGLRSDTIENFLEDIDGLGIEALRKLILQEKLTDLERAQFANYVAVMHSRTHAHRQGYAEMALAYLQTELYLNAANPEAFETVVRRHEEEHGVLTLDQRESLRQGMLDPSQFEVHVDKEWTLAALGTHERTAPIIDRMNWMLIKAPESVPFITSDNPVHYDVPKEYRPKIGGAGLLHKHVELTFPLNADWCLLATHKKGLAEVGTLAPTDARRMNSIRAMNAERFLFSRDKSAGIAKLAAKYKSAKPKFAWSGGPDTLSRVNLERRPSLRGTSTD